MQKITLINPYSSTVISDISSINLFNNGLTYFDIEDMSINQPYLAIVKVNANFGYWEELRTQDLGFRIETDNINLAFVKVDRKMGDFGEQEIRLASASYNLKYSYSYPDQNYSGSLATFLSNLNSNYVFTPVSGDRNIEIETGWFNDLELLTMALKKAKGWSWRDNGLVTSGGTTKPQILYGDFGADITNAYNADPTKTWAKPGYLSQFQKIDNWKTTDNASLNWIHENESGEYYTYIVSSYSIDGTNNPNSRVVLDPNLITQDGQFPIITVTKSGQQFYAVQNPFVPFFPEKGLFEVMQSPVNAENQAGTQEVSSGLTPQKLYSETIAKIKANLVKTNLTFDEKNLKEIILPGNDLFLSWKQVLTLKDGTTRELYNIQNQRKSLNNLKFNLNEIKN